MVTGTKAPSVLDNRPGSALTPPIHNSAWAPNLNTADTPTLGSTSVQSDDTLVGLTREQSDHAVATETSRLLETMEHDRVAESIISQSDEAKTEVAGGMIQETEALQRFIAKSSSEARQESRGVKSQSEESCNFLTVMSILQKRISWMNLALRDDTIHTAQLAQELDQQFGELMRLLPKVLVPLSTFLDAFTDFQSATKPVLNSVKSTSSHSAAQAYVTSQSPSPGQLGTASSYVPGTSAFVHLVSENHGGCPEGGRGIYDGTLDGTHRDQI